MYTKYTYSAGATAANVLADVIALLTGETNKANLSASCNQANTEILTSWCVAGWTLHDASAGTNAKAIKAVKLVIAGDPELFKYVVVDTNSAGYILTKVYETWNETAHTGTNLCYNSGTGAFYSQRLNLTNGGILYISSSVRHLNIISYQSAVWGSSSYLGSSGCFERTRKAPWDTGANAYPPFLWANFGAIANGDTAFAPRYKKYDNTDVITSNACLYCVLPYGSGHPSLIYSISTYLGLDASLNSVHIFHPIAFAYYTNQFQGGEISGFSDTWFTTYNYGAALDEVTKDGNTYVIWPAFTTYRLAIRKG